MSESKVMVECYRELVSDLIVYALSWQCLGWSL